MSEYELYLTTTGISFFVSSVVVLLNNFILYRRRHLDTRQNKKSDQQMAVRPLDQSVRPLDQSVRPLDQSVRPLDQSAIEQIHRSNSAPQPAQVQSIPSPLQAQFRLGRDPFKQEQNQTIPPNLLHQAHFNQFALAPQPVQVQGSFRLRPDPFQQESAISQVYNPLGQGSVPSALGPFQFPPPPPALGPFQFPPPSVQDPFEREQEQKPVQFGFGINTGVIRGPSERVQNQFTLPQVQDSYEQSVKVNRSNKSNF
jgi:hypothetical protein